MGKSVHAHLLTNLNMAIDQAAAKAALATLLLEGAEIALEMEEEEEVKKPKRQCWVRSWLSSGSEGQHATLVYNDILKDDELEFSSAFRMNKETFNYILEKIRPDIEKKDTPLRMAITADIRLMLTLVYLASGPSYQVLGKLFRVSKTSIQRIVPETCDAIWNRLAADEIKMPSSEEQWEEKAREFGARWQYPKAIGCIDGKHCSMVAPGNSGSSFFNYKGHFSFVLMAVCDANYRFIYVDIGSAGSTHDATVFQNSSFGQMLQADTLHLPPKPVDGIPLHFLSDDAFGLQDRIMKPFPHSSLEPKERVYNYRLSRARRTVESAFGIMSNRFRLLRRPMDLDYDNCVKCVQAITVLHNLLLKKGGSRVAADDDLLGECSMPPINTGGKFNASGNATARQIRNEMADYFFSGDGQVEFQWKNTFGM